MASSHFTTISKKVFEFRNIRNGNGLLKPEIQFHEDTFCHYLVVFVNTAPHSPNTPSFFSCHSTELKKSNLLRASF